MLSMEYTCAIDYNRTKTSVNLPLMVLREVISFFTVFLNQVCDVLHRRVAVRGSDPTPRRNAGHGDLPQPACIAIPWGKHPRFPGGEPGLDGERGAPYGEKGGEGVGTPVSPGAGEAAGAGTGKPGYLRGEAA